MAVALHIIGLKSDYDKEEAHMIERHNVEVESLKHDIA